MNRYIIETILDSLKEKFFNVSVQFHNDPNWKFREDHHEDELYLFLSRRSISKLNDFEGLNSISYSFQINGFFQLTDIEFTLDLASILDQLVETLYLIKFTRYPHSDTATDEQIKGITEDGKASFTVEYAFNLTLDNECVENIANYSDDVETPITAVSLRINNLLE